MTEVFEKSTIRSRRRQAILDAATEEFCRSGFEHARMEAIAARACIGKSTIYEYFPSKDALLRAVGEKMAEHAAHEIQTVLQSELSFRSKIIGYMRFLDSLIAQMGEKIIQLFREDSSHTLMDELGREYAAMIEHALVSEVERAKHAGELDPQLDAAVAVTLLRSIPCAIFHGSDVAVESLVDLLLRGMGAQNERT